MVSAFIAIRPFILLIDCQMATLAVQEAMGMKVDREAVATLVLPQLWGMSIGPSKSISIPSVKQILTWIK